MTVRMTVRAMNAATAILRPCDSLAAAMDGYSPERSGSDLLMQSAGLLIICHMREETTGTADEFLPRRNRRGSLHRENRPDTFDCKNRQGAGQIPRERRRRSIGLVALSRGISACTSRRNSQCVPIP